MRMKEYTVVGFARDASGVVVFKGSNRTLSQLEYSLKTSGHTEIFLYEISAMTKDAAKAHLLASLENLTDEQKAALSIPVDKVAASKAAAAARKAEKNRTKAEIEAAEAKAKADAEAKAAEDAKAAAEKSESEKANKAAKVAEKKKNLSAIKDAAKTASRKKAGETPASEAA